MFLILLEKELFTPSLNFGVSSLEQPLVNRDEGTLDWTGASLTLVLRREVSGQAQEKGDISYFPPQGRGTVHPIYRIGSNRFTIF